MRGLEHIERDFVMLKIPLNIIEEHQELFPELKDRMIGPDALKRYIAFLTLLPYQTKKELTKEEKIRILKKAGVL